ncbi:MAG: metallophosphoesterase [Patescibacteria group bacterium]
MNLRKTQACSWCFDLFLAGVAVFGLAVAYPSFSVGGWWNLLGASALIGEVLLFFGIFITPKNLTVKTYRMELRKNNPVWLRIVLLSDLHAGGFHDLDWYSRIVNEVNSQKPDVILLAGDYVVDHAGSMNLLKPLSALKASLGSYFVLGNHDYLDRPQEIRQALVDWGFCDLSNQSKILEYREQNLEIQGVDDSWSGYPKKFKRKGMDVPHITLCHEPDCVMDLKEGDTDLVLSGHTHGGQVRLPVIGPLWPIPSKLGSKLDRDLKIVNGVKCIISSGLGETDGRLRLFSPPQIVVVEVGI